MGGPRDNNQFHPVHVVNNFNLLYDCFNDETKTTAKPSSKRVSMICQEEEGTSVTIIVLLHYIT
jgi:hypothetical protein